MNYYYPPRRPTEPKNIDTPRLPVAGFASLLDSDFDGVDYAHGDGSRGFARSPYGRCEGAE